MAIGAQYIRDDLEELGILERAFGLYPHYKFVITGNVNCTFFPFSLKGIQICIIIATWTSSQTC